MFLRFLIYQKLFKLKNDIRIVCRRGIGMIYENFEVEKLVKNWQKFGNSFVIVNHMNFALQEENTPKKAKFLLPKQCAV